jgi:hypothetical protein
VRPRFHSSWFTNNLLRLPFYYGWVIVGVAILAQLVSGFGQPYEATVFIESIRNEFGWSLTLLSALYTGGSVLAAALILLALPILCGVATLFAVPPTKKRETAAAGSDVPTGV